MANERYMRSHPEIKAVVSAFTKAVLREKPDDIKAFASNWFAADDLRKIVEAESTPTPLA